jgi:hypothetical protein
VTPRVQGLLSCGARVHIAVTLPDGSPVTDIDGATLAIDRRHSNELIVRTDDGAIIHLPLEPVTATVLPLPRPGGVA